MNGLVTYDKTKRQWRIAAAPHIAIRLKRVFGKLSKRHHGVLFLSDTEENARDLAWFLDRYPMEVKDRSRLDDRAAAHRERMALVDALLSRKLPTPTFDLELPPREYQRVAAALVLASGGLLLADEVGLGKTVTSICMMSDPRALPALVVTLTHLPKQWEREIKRFAPKLRTHILKKGTPYDLTSGRGGLQRSVQMNLDGSTPAGSMPDVIITSYSKLAGWGETLAGLQFGSVTFDEVHELRNMGGGGKPTPAKYSAAKLIAESTPIRLGMSASPIFNYGGEFYSVLNILRPNAVGTKGEFLEEWCGGFKEKIVDTEAFGSYLREGGLMLRRSRKDVGRELPNLTKVIHHVEADAEALDRVSADCAELARTILKQGETQRGEKMHAAEELSNRLRQATGIAKCLAPGTRVVKYDGSLARVEDLRGGDLLMGPDSRPRRVLATTHGEDEMFEVSSTSRRPLFKPYFVNSNHILALKHSGAIRHGDRFLFAPYVKGDHVEISVRDYITKSNHFRRLLKGYKAAGVKFPKVEVPLDPYFLGLWLGDGSSDCVAITTEDEEIRRYVYELAETHDLEVSIKYPNRTAPTYRIHGPVRGWGTLQGRSRNPLRVALRALGVLGNKHVPRTYLVNDRETRLALLAGLLDADGHLNAGGGYTLATRWKHLADEVCWLAWSLGFAASSRQVSTSNQTGQSFLAHIVSIFGAGLEHLPMRIVRKKARPRRQIKDALRSGISVKSIGRGPYYGFELDGDGLFLLEDFTVTHNSPYVADFVRMLVESGEKVLVLAWHREVYAILNDRLKDFSPVMYTGSESPSAKEASRKAFVDGDAKVLLMSLRAGAGLDGLQHACRTVVIAELDWSPAVHHQSVGRVHRDGQPDPVIAYFLVADHGADPIIVDILGLKKEQIDGVIDPNAELIERLEVDGDRIKRLAEGYLVQRFGQAALSEVA